MIAYLKGRIKEKTTNFVVLENQGLGYKVFSTPEILEKKTGEEVEVYTYLKVAETEQSLFGLPCSSLRCLSQLAEWGPKWLWLYFLLQEWKQFSLRLRTKM